MNSFMEGTCSWTVFADDQLQANQITPNNNIKSSHIVDFRSIKFNRLKAIFSGLDGIQHVVRGRQAQTICWLHERQQRGVTAHEMSSWALRLGAYVHILRHQHNVNIRTDKEQHEGGSHGRYVLISPIEILRIEDLSR